MAVSNAKIGSLQFIGDVTPYVFGIVNKLRAIERDGIDGEELIIIGKRGPEMQWQTFQDVTNLSATVAAYVNISGSTQTITNVDASTVAGVAVELQAMDAKPIVKSVGGLSSGAGVWAVSAVWKLQATI